MNGWDRTDVWYSEEWGGWMVTAYDSENNEIGDSEFSYLKRDAMYTAQGYFDAGRCDSVVIEKKDGFVQKIIERAA